MRLNRSTLNAHTYSIGLSQSPNCQCNSIETVEHYLYDCFLFTEERHKLFSLVEHYLPSFKNKNKKSKVDILLYRYKASDQLFNYVNTKITIAKIDILLYGYKASDQLFDYVNTKITIAVQNFILNTKRFHLT